jgi:hypothetical protein
MSSAKLQVRPILLMQAPKVFWIKEIVITLCKIRQLYEFYA